jgi:YfiH family protein
VTLPIPHPAFRWTLEPWGAALRCRPLEAVAQHLFTSAQLQLTGGLDHTAAPWAAALASVTAVPDRLRRVRQVHGREVRVIAGTSPGEEAAERPIGDALASDVAGLALAVVVADCVPILIGDARTGAAAAVHAGWRGTCARVAEEAVSAMVRRFDARPGDLVAALGPSIGPADYEVGESVVADFEAAGHAREALARWFPRVDGRLRLDLWTANADQLSGAGVNPAAIHVCGLSTFPYAGLFESFRRDGTKSGRMTGIIVVPARV